MFDPYEERPYSTLTDLERYEGRYPDLVDDIYSDSAFKFILGADVYGPEYRQWVAKCNGHGVLSIFHNRRSPLIEEESNYMAKRLAMEINTQIMKSVLRHLWGTAAAD